MESSEVRRFEGPEMERERDCGWRVVLIWFGRKRKICTFWSETERQGAVTEHWNLGTFGLREREARDKGKWRAPAQRGATFEWKLWFGTSDTKLGQSIGQAD